MISLPADRRTGGTVRNNRSEDSVSPETNLNSLVARKLFAFHSRLYFFHVTRLKSDIVLDCIMKRLVNYSSDHSVKRFELNVFLFL